MLHSYVSEDVEIVPDDVDGDVRWFGAELCEGQLHDGRVFRCQTTPGEWMRFVIN